MGPTISSQCRAEIKRAMLLRIQPKTSWATRWKAVKHGGILEIIIVFGISMGGLFAGIFTPTEAGVVGVTAMLIVSIFQRNLTFKAFLKSLKETVRLTCFIYLLIAGATVYGKSFALTGIPAKLGDYLEHVGMSPFMVLFLMACIYFVMSFVIDAQVLVLLTIPIFYPIIVDLGFDGIWFGAFTVVVVGIGDITPPVSLLIYVMHGVAKKQPDIKEIFIGVCPFMFAGFIMLVLLILFPQLATFLPSLL